MPRAARSPADLLDTKILSLVGVRKGRSRFEHSPAYFIGTQEVAHLHGARELDLRLTRAVIRERRADLRSDARIGFRSSPSDWLTVALRNAVDVEFAFELFEEAWRAAQ